MFSFPGKRRLDDLETDSILPFQVVLQRRDPRQEESCKNASYTDRKIRALCVRVLVLQESGRAFGHAYYKIVERKFCPLNRIIFWYDFRMDIEILSEFHGKIVEFLAYSCQGEIDLKLRIVIHGMNYP